MASGVKVDDSCKKVFDEELKMGKKLRYLIFKLSDDLTKVEIQERGQKDATFADLVERLREAEANSECRYAVFDAEGCKNDKQFQKILFIAWSPDTAKIKQKMVYASSKDAVKRALGEGIAMEVQANDHSDMDWEDIADRIVRTMRK